MPISSVILWPTENTGTAGGNKNAFKEGLSNNGSAKSAAFFAAIAETDSVEASPPQTTPVGEVDAKQSAHSSTAKEFLDYVDMDPIERIRASYLKENNLTEEQLAQMPTEEREKIEEEIRKRIEQKLTGNQLGRTGQVVDVKV